ncbi:MAG: HD domain-containing protein [Acidimicrobiia bacterium]|nr:HD domain-containing protein [Acidimicrobiia bacterium]
MEPVAWTEMNEGTQADYEMLGQLYEEHSQGELVENLVNLLTVMKGPKLGYQIDRYEHSLQSASRALRAEESLDLVVAALLHDIGDSVAPANHSAMAASILRPYVDDETHWVVQHHGLFQGYYYFHHFDGDRNARDVHREHEHYEACVKFCHNYDQNCFDPDYPNIPIADFIPLMDELFSRPSRVPGVAPVGMTADLHVN